MYTRACDACLIMLMCICTCFKFVYLHVCACRLCACGYLGVSACVYVGTVFICLVRENVGMCVPCMRVVRVYERVFPWECVWQSFTSSVPVILLSLPMSRLDCHSANGIGQRRVRELAQVCVSGVR